MTQEEWQVELNRIIETILMYRHQLRSIMADRNDLARSYGRMSPEERVINAGRSQTLRDEMIQILDQMNLAEVRHQEHLTASKER